MTEDGICCILDDLGDFLEDCEVQRLVRAAQRAHGGPILSGAIIPESTQREFIAAAEVEKPDKRPSCGWPVPNPDQKVKGTVPCGSEERVYTVKGKGRYTGRSRETNICEKHVPEAWKAWPGVESADPCIPTRSL